MSSFQEIEEKEHSCSICDFTRKWKNGLAVHMTRKHCHIEQLDETSNGTGQDEKLRDVQ